jgi:hypothetical protein
MAQGYEESHGSIENGKNMVRFSLFHTAVSMECFHDHCTSAAQQKTAAFGEEMLLFFTTIAHF